ncbi:MAG: extracellular solute-binding protein [Bacteroidota bacterium]
MKTGFPLLLSLLIVCCGLACTNDKQPAAGGGVQAGPGPINRAVAPVRLMTWRYLPQDAAIIQSFETRYAVKVDVTVRPMAEIIADAVAGKQLEAEVLLVPTLEDAARLRGFNALQPFFVDAFTNGDVADRYLDNEGYWAGLSRWTMVTVYNPNSVTASEASSYSGILKAVQRGQRLGVAHPDSSGLAGVVAGLHQNINPDAAALWAKAMYERSVGGPQGSDYDQMDRMLAGELDLAFVSLGAVVRWFLNGDPQHFAAAEQWRVRFPRTAATDINFYNMTCVTMPANTPNRDMAARLIDFLFQRENQEQMSNGWFEFPVQTFAEANSYLYGFPDAIGLKVSGETIENNLPAAWGIINGVALEQQ